MTQFNKSGAEGYLVKGIQAYEEVVSHCPDDDDDFTYYRQSLEIAKWALQDKREGKTGKVSISTQSKLRRRPSVTDSLRSTQSSDESCPSRPASII